MHLTLKPSDIFYSQNYITDTFGRSTDHKGKKIGETLDDLYYGRIKIDKIPRISVVKKNGKWYTLDNRRLWILHHLQGAGKCDEIEVKEAYRIDSRKFTTTNEGISVSIYKGRNPGGRCHRFIKPVTPNKIENEIQESNSKIGASETTVSASDDNLVSIDNLVSNVSTNECIADNDITVEESDSQISNNENKDVSPDKQNNEMPNPDLAKNENEIELGEVTHSLESKTKELSANSKSDVSQIRNIREALRSYKPKKHRSVDNDEASSVESTHDIDDENRESGVKRLFDIKEGTADRHKKVKVDKLGK